MGKKKKLTKDQRRKKVMQKRLQRQIKWDEECWKRATRNSPDNISARIIEKMKERESQDESRE